MITEQIVHQILFTIEQMFYLVRTACILTLVIVAITAIVVMVLYNLKK